MNIRDVPLGFKSDGCTFPGILNIFKQVMGADKYHYDCLEHDFLRRYEVVHWFKSNVILATRISNHHIAGMIRAPFYLFFTTISYPAYNKTERLPDKWRHHAASYDDKWEDRHG